MTGILKTALEISACDRAKIEMHGTLVKTVRDLMEAAYNVNMVINGEYLLDEAMNRASLVLKRAKDISMGES